VLCSPQSAASRYVDTEVAYFASIGRGERIVPVILDGEPPVCFPLTLNDGRERLGADFRPGKDERNGGSIKALAGLLGVSKDELIQRERVAQRWRTRAFAALALGFAGLAVATVGFGLLASERAADLRRERDAAIAAREMAKS
jgi:hypothetical protein